jgi:hypothetical protein
LAAEVFGEECVAEDGFDGREVRGAEKGWWHFDWGVNGFQVCCVLL